MYEMLFVPLGSLTGIKSDIFYIGYKISIESLFLTSIKVFHALVIF